MSATTEAGLRLRISEARRRDVGRGVARLDPADLEELGVEIGDIVQIAGKRDTFCKAMPAFKEQRGEERLHLDGISRENAGVGLDEFVVVSQAVAAKAHTVDLAPRNITPSARDLDYIGSLLDGLPVVRGDRVRVTLFGSRWTDFTVTATRPAGAVIIQPDTQLRIGKAEKGTERGGGAVSYEDIGGLERQLHRIREMIELPLRYPEVFERLGIDAPSGVLLHGPPGCGKTLIARAIAHETEAAFFTVSGPEIIHKFYGESEAHLRKVFEQAAAKAPAILFLDEIDAIAPAREKVVGDVEKRVVAQLLALMDGLSGRKQLIVIAATNLPNALDPALRRPGRFDREIHIPIPDRRDRLEILEVHSRGMPLAEDVDIGRIADLTHGFVGADLEALCREAAMARLRHIMAGIDFGLAHIPYDQLQALEVRMADFQAARHEVEPSAIREVFVDTPDVSWEDVAGLAELKEQLIETVHWPLRYTDLFRRAGVRPAKGILLHGPPGCGKTLIAKALANESEVNFISIKGASLMSKYVGESEKGVGEIFKKARQAAPSILFFDEIDALVPARSAGASDARVSERVLSQFLVELDGIEELSDVLVLAATNRPDLVDEAILRAGRFDVAMEVPRPRAAERQAIFAVHLQGKPLAAQVDLEKLGEMSAGLSGAEIAEVSRRAALDALRRVISGAGESEPEIERLEVTNADLLRNVDALRKKTDLHDRPSTPGPTGSENVENRHKPNQKRAAIRGRNPAIRGERERKSPSASRSAPAKKSSKKTTGKGGKT